MAKATKSATDFVKEGNGFADITLSRPAKFDGVETSTIRMREPTAGDIESFHEAKGTEAAREITTLANLCELAPDDIRALPFRDFTRLQAAFALFTA